MKLEGEFVCLSVCPYIINVCLQLPDSLVSQTSTEKTLEQQHRGPCCRLPRWLGSKFNARLLTPLYQFKNPYQRERKEKPGQVG